jgi:hypothetical protein
MTSPADAFSDARERYEAAGERSPGWVPIAAAVLAVLTAISGFLANIRATNAIFAKNEAIVATTHAADTWNEYEARSIKQHIYEAASVTAASGNVARLRAVADHERTAARPVMEKARSYEEEAERDNARSERLLGSHEILEVSTTLFEVSIVLVSITALLGSQILPVVAAVASAAGLVILGVGLVR